jgi:hypothetical protein
MQRRIKEQPGKCQNSMDGQIHGCDVYSFSQIPQFDVQNTYWQICCSIETSINHILNVKGIILQQLKRPDLQNKSRFQ